MKTKTSCSTIALLFVLVLVAGGCGFSDIDGPPSGPVHQDSGSYSDSGPSGPQSILPPTVDPISPTLCGEKIPIQGTAQPGHGIGVFVVGTDIAKDANPETGRFCLDVPLKPNTLNTLELATLHPVWGMSQTVTVNVNHRPCEENGNPPPDPGPAQTPSTNVALGGNVITSKIVDLSNPQMIVDGDPNNYATFRGSDSPYPGDPPIWVMIQLDGQAVLDKIIIRWRDGLKSNPDCNNQKFWKPSKCQYATKYRILRSKAADPGDPTVNGGNWHEITKIEDGQGDIETFDIKASAFTAYHIALWLEKNGESDIAEDFSISEVEVWDIPQNSKPVPTTSSYNTCSSIGG